MHLTFRPITEDDYDVAEAFKRATVRDMMGTEALFGVWFPPERSYRDFLRRTQAFDREGCVFAWVGDEIVGGLHLCLRDDGTGYLNNIYLKPEWRGQRLGDALEAFAVAYFKRHGASYATLRTYPQQPKSMAFYARLGWQLVGPHEDGMVELGKAF